VYGFYTNIVGTCMYPSCCLGSQQNGIHATSEINEVIIPSAIYSSVWTTVPGSMCWACKVAQSLLAIISMKLVAGIVWESLVAPLTLILWQVTQRWTFAWFLEGSYCGSHS